MSISTTQQTEPTPAEMYETFYGSAIFSPCAQLVLERAAPQLGEAVLDLACGTGQVARRVAPTVGMEGSVTALDLNPNMLAVGRSLPTPKGASIDWVQGDAVAPEFPDGSFDLVVCQHGLQFFPDRAAALNHARRLLKPGGRMVVAVWARIDRHPLLSAMAEAELRYLESLGLTRGELTIPFSLGGEEELTGLLTGAGFSGVEIEERSIEARFPGPDMWVRNMQYAYAAVIPEFAEDRPAFEHFVAAVEAEIEELVREHTRGNQVVVPMHALIAWGATMESSS